MNSYRINFNQLRQQPEISGMLSALERGFARFGIDFYLVGAVARDVWMMGIHKMPPTRTTGDIDFAVLVNDKGIYETLKAYLVEQENFQPIHDNAFVLLWKNKTQVDLLPFGAIENEDGSVTVEGTGFTTVHVPGFNEIYEEGLPVVVLEETHEFKFCTLPGIVILKLIAWDDRPENRRDDIKDISDILHYFFDMHDEEIWENHSDLFDDEDADLKHIAARVMGREMHKIARRKNKLYKKIGDILETNTVNTQTSTIAGIMAAHFENTVEDNIKLLRQLKKGFAEDLLK
ncbi:MAG TPA: hypothetical protein VFW07_25195 [Parafilimonas sp.]|nr:hypothetical protein [Parafilimonas sp.]